MLHSWKKYYITNEVSLYKSFILERIFSTKGAEVAYKSIILFRQMDISNNTMIIANKWKQQQSIMWRPSLFSMQMNYQLILVHWPSRTLGDHRQLAVASCLLPCKHNLTTQTRQIWKRTSHKDKYIWTHWHHQHHREEAKSFVSFPLKRGGSNDRSCSSRSPLLLQLWNNIWLLGRGNKLYIK